MSRILIDDREYEVDPQHNLLQAILSLGLDLPYFCWHPALGSVGSCRQCAVLQYQDENDSRGRLVVACMTPVQDGMRIGLEAPPAREFRATVIEALMTNHPHDCPVCEEGGECHLQDMTEMSGHTLRRYRGLKRTHRNQYLGPFINHEMNRCIACYRCVRFYRDYAGGDDLGVQAAHNHVYFGRAEEGALQSPFSGNLVEVCPTGVFTDRTFSRHFSRKWDQQTAPSVCVHCAVGCNTFAAERYGRVVRITNRFHAGLNGYFLCDRGRFGYDFQNQARPGEFSDSEVLLDGLLRRIADPSQAVFAVGSPRASLENNFALATLVGERRFFAGVGAAEWRCLQRYLAIAASGCRFATPAQIEQCDAALVLGEDIGATAPRVALSLRRMVRNRSIELAEAQKIAPWQDAAVRALGQWQQSPLWQLVPFANALADISDGQRFESPDAIARMALGLASRLEGSEFRDGLTDAQQSWIEAAALMLLGSRRPLLVSGTGLADSRLLDAAARITRALGADERTPQLYIAVRESNSVGLAALCPHGLDELLEQAEVAMGHGKRCTLVVLENDLSQRLSHEQFGRLRAVWEHWLALDCIPSPSTRAADAVVPVPSAFEQQGTLVNASGLLQRSEAAMAPKSAPPWRLFGEAVGRFRNRFGELTEPGWIELSRWDSAGRLRQSLAECHPALAAAERAGLDAGVRLDGRRLARQSPRYSGRTAMHAAEQVKESPPAKDTDSPFSFSMEGAPGLGGWRDGVWEPGWNSVQALNRWQREVGGDWRDSWPGAWLDAAALGREADNGSTPGPKDEGTVTWIPCYEVFAGEPLSDAADAIRERAGEPQLGVDIGTAQRLGLESLDSLELHYQGRAHTLLVHIDSSLPEGCIAVPQRAGFWQASVDPSPRMELRPARQPLPKPPRLIASDRTGSGTMAEWLTIIIRALGLMLVLVLSAALLTWAERRLLGLWQDRYGPNRVGPFGLLQVVADMLKLLGKQEFVPSFADKPVFILAPAVAMATMLLAFAVIPFTPAFPLADLNVGLLFFLAMSSLSVYAVLLGGYASNNKYALLGALRAAAQALSYEVFMGLSLLGVVLQAGSFSLGQIVEAQRDLWFCIPQALGMVLFFIAGIAASHRLPFDLPEAEHELTAGFHTEYSGMKFGMFFVGEYLGVILVSALMTTLFFGGWLGPLLPPWLWFVLKTGFFVLLFVLLRAALPRPRYDQLMAFGWKCLLPLALLNLTVTGLVLL